MVQMEKDATQIDTLLETNINVPGVVFSHRLPCLKRYTTGLRDTVGLEDIKIKATNYETNNSQTQTTNNDQEDHLTLLSSHATSHSTQTTTKRPPEQAEK